MYPIAIYYRKTDVEMVFHFEKFCDLLWEKIVDVIKKNFLDSCLKADNLQNKNNSLNINRIPYARHYNPLLIRILTIHKPLEKTFLDFKKWVKSIETAGYNGARTVLF